MATKAKDVIAVDAIANRKHPNCIKCGLFMNGQCNTPFMPGHGPHNGVVIVGEAPGRQEDEQGRAFVGASGKMMRKALADRGIDPKLCFWTNAARCRPPNNKIKPSHVSKCRIFLETELREVQPRVMLLVGNSALMAVMKRGGILKQRRNVLTYTYTKVIGDRVEQFRVPCVACLHPAYIMRAQDMRGEFEEDLNFFASLVSSTQKTLIEVPDKTRTRNVVDLVATVPLNIHPTLKDVEDFAQSVYKNNSVVGYDTETDTLRPYVEKDFALLCLGVSDGTRTLVVRCDEPVTPTVDAAILKYGSDPHTTKKKLRVLIDLLRDEKIRKAAHSSKYDYHVINSRFGQRVKNLWVDTRVLHSMLYSIEGMAHDLDSVMAAMLGAWKYKHITSEWVGENENNPKKFLTVPYENLATRNGLDCYACVAVIKPMLRELAKITRTWERVAEIKRTSPTELFHKLQMPLLESLAKVEARGMQTDQAYIQSFRVELTKNIEEAQSTMRRMRAVKEFEGMRRAEMLDEVKALKRYPSPEAMRKRMDKIAFNANSRDQVAQILLGHFHLGAMGVPLQYTDTNKVSTSEEALASYAAFARNHSLDEAAKFIECVQTYAACVKGRGTFIDGVAEFVDEGGRVHTSYNQDITRTGRLSSSDPNMQNIPIRGREGKDDPRYRKMFIAKAGHTLISADYSQVELRVLAAYGRDETMIEIFKSGRDLHTETARRAFGLPEGAEVDKFKRRVAKTVNFGVVYGQTVTGLAAGLGIDEAEADKLLHAIMRQFPGAVRWIARTKAFARKHGVVFTWFGRPRPLANATLDSNDGGLVSAAERRAVNTPVQGSANEICEIAFHVSTRYFESRSFPCWPVAIIHDQIIFECQDDHVSRAIPIIRKLCIDSPMKALGPDFIVPLVVDISVGRSWGELKDV